jgi:hypothetical protein
VGWLRTTVSLVGLGSHRYRDNSKCARNPDLLRLIEINVVPAGRASLEALGHISDHFADAPPGSGVPIMLKRIVLLGMALTLAPSPASAAVFTVNTTAASGSGSLDAVINAANATPGTDTIEFAIPGTGVKTLIAPAAGYSAITDGLIVNGNSQAGSVLNSIANDATNAVIRVEIDAAAVTMASSRVFMQQSGTLVLRGLALKNLAADVWAIRQASGAGTLSVYGCFLGTDATGSSDLSAGNAIEIGAVANVGSGNPADRNLISGNSLGVVVQASSNSAFVKGNLFGTDASGSGVLPNLRAIDIDASAIATHLIGGTGPSDGNRITGSTGSSLRLFGSGIATWQRNRIYSNAGLGVDIGGDGIDSNDPGDGDSGPNGRENAPVMYSAYVVGSTLRVNGSLDGNFIAGAKRVEFFASALADPTGYGEGDRYLGEVTIFPGASISVVEFKSFITPATMPAMPFVVSAISTSVAGASSEFSNVVSAADAGSVRTVTTVADAGAGSLRQAMLDANANPGADLVLFNIPGSGPHTIAPLSALPALSDNTIIDGYSQPGALHNNADNGWNGAIRIVLDGATAGGADGLRLNGGSSRVHGLAIGNFGGVAIGQFGGSIHLITGNLIGTDASGLLDRGNSIGISGLAGVAGGAIGGPWPYQRNVISGNAAGLILGGMNATVWGNYVGVAADEVTSLGNDNSGILVSGSGVRIFGNLVRNNLARGVGVSGTTARVVIRSNRIYGNGQLGIDLNNDGPTANDANDGDSGPNELQNFPILTRARAIVGAGTLIEGTLDRPASAGALSYELEFASNASCDNSGYGEGEAPFAVVTLTLATPADESFSVWLPGYVMPPGRAVTATATAIDGIDFTSEYSPCIISTLADETMFDDGFE